MKKPITSKRKFSRNEGERGICSFTVDLWTEDINENKFVACTASHPKTDLKILKENLANRLIFINVFPKMKCTRLAIREHVNKSLEC